MHTLTENMILLLLAEENVFWENRLRNCIDDLQKEGIKREVEL